MICLVFIGYRAGIAEIPLLAGGYRTSTSHALQWGAFLLTVDNFSFFAYSWSFFAYSFSFLTYSWSFFAYSGKMHLIRALRDCKQRSLTVSKKAPTVSKKASPQKLPPHCLETIFDSRFASPNLSPKMPPKLSLPPREGIFPLSKLPLGRNDYILYPEKIKSCKETGLHCSN